MAFSASVGDEAFVTLATNDSYCYGALVLGQSLRDVGTTRKLAILIAPMVTQSMRQQLSQIYDYIQQVDPLDSQDEANLALLARPDLGITFSKLHCWRLTQFTKCVFLDADCLVLRNVDDLFEREELSASPDVGWPDCFNSGVFVFRPSDETYAALLQCAVTHGSFDGGDQGLLNTFFSDWSTKDIKRHLPFVYNMTSSCSYSYKPAFVKFGQNVRIVHFIGATKPWSLRYDMQTGTLRPHDGTSMQHDSEFIQAWWNIFLTKIKPRIETTQEIQNLRASRISEADCTRSPPVDEVKSRGVLRTSKAPTDSFQSPVNGCELASEVGQISLEDKGQTPTRTQSNLTRQEAWEKGEIDYMGEDRFSNILEHIESTLKEGEKS
ncbi:glycogenin-1-like [Anneissia japonica]|uniref:glycogenin-1-like n=1 Tax=Anneissia japonica TaxID=1529436 RepID=UPI001425652C|nr:glycogenin-1-like [Anneissia japonica]